MHRSLSVCRVGRCLRLVLSLLAVGAILPGCGKSGEPPAQSAASSTSAGPATPQAATSGSSETAGASQSETALVNQDSSGRKWIAGEIPYDVWYSDPLGVANDTRPVNATPGSRDPGPTDDISPPATAPAAPEPASPGGSGNEIDWKSIIAKEILEDEVKQGRNRLKQNLISIGKYNGNYKEIAADAVSISAMAGIAARHADAVSWKDKAKYVRDLSADVADNATTLGKPAYDATLLPFENLEVVLSGGMPADLGESQDKLDFALHADRGALMRRMERADNWLRKEVRTADIFKNEAETVTHEAAILAAMAKVITTPDYGSEGEAEYKQSAQEMFEASRAILTAVQIDDFNGFGQAMNKIKKACDECHRSYRFAEEF
jgi:cytochrome c556